MLIELLKLDKKSNEALYRQLISQLTSLIKNEVVKAGYRLPGSRKLSKELGVHRQTVVAAIDQLVMEGWLETAAGKGTYVCDVLSPSPLHYGTEVGALQRAPVIHVPNFLQRDLHLTTQKYHLDDGLPDPRLAPAMELARSYKGYLSKGNLYPKFTYGDTKGHLFLRAILCEYLKESRAMILTPDQIIITRGVTQALYLCIQGFLKKGDKVAVGALNWESANANFLYHGAELIKVKVDDQGLNTADLERVLQEHAIKMVYLTPHHQYPTTVIMPAARRLHLIRLARQYGSYVFEDDYDYDFYYSPNPVMPLAAVEHGDYVLYAGSFTKAISPVFRIGYLVANTNQVDYLSRIRRMIDRQGDAILELAIAELLKLGTIQRCLRRNRKLYQQRRDYFDHLLQAHLSEYIHYQLPSGGMSLWTQFDPAIDLRKLYERALNHDLFIPSGEQVSGIKPNVNATRLGYASSNEEELEASVKILKQLIAKPGN